MTAPIVSVGADTEQAPNVCNDSITDIAEDSKSLDIILRKCKKNFQSK